MMRSAGGTTTSFLYDGGQVLLEKQATITTATYTYGSALILKDGETPLFDGLGSERTVTNSSQTVTGTATYEGFGQTVATTGSSTDPYMFAATSSYRNDGDAGLMHVGARYYDAQVGRFITRDTDLNQKPYLYCEHDPIDAVDPSGHDLRSFIRAILIAIAWEKEPEPIQVKEPVPIVRIGGGTPPPPPGGGRTPPTGGGNAGSGGGPGAIVTIGIGIGVGVQAGGQAYKWSKAIRSYLNPDGDWSESGGF